MSNQAPLTIVDAAATKRLLKLLRNWSVREISSRRKAVNPKARRVSLWAFLVCVIAPLLLAIVLAAVYHYSKIKGWATASIFALLLEYLGALVYPFIELFLHRKNITHAICRPYNSILKNVEVVASLDARYTNILCQYSDVDLEFMKLELRAQKNALQMRIKLVTGSIEKVGLIPGVLAIAVILAKLGSQQPNWVYAIAYATPFLYVMAVMMHMLIVRAERHLELIDFALNETLTRRSSGRRSRAAA